MQTKWIQVSSIGKWLNYYSSLSPSLSLLLNKYFKKNHVSQQNLCFHGRYVIFEFCSCKICIKGRKKRVCFNLYASEYSHADIFMYVTVFMNVWDGVLYWIMSFLGKLMTCLETRMCGDELMIGTGGKSLTMLCTCWPRKKRWRNISMTAFEL